VILTTGEEDRWSVSDPTGSDAPCRADAELASGRRTLSAWRALHDIHGWSTKEPQPHGETRSRQRPSSFADLRSRAPQPGHTLRSVLDHRSRGADAEGSACARAEKGESDAARERATLPNSDYEPSQNFWTISLI
jgi:hypothetical protein